MKTRWTIYLCLFAGLHLWASDATMYQWESHFAYGSVSHLVESQELVYALAGNALFSVNKTNDEIQTYSKQDGLNGGDIAQIGYDPVNNTLIIAYADGLIDFMKDGQCIAMTDLQQKTMTTSKYTNNIVVENGLAYFCMPFGVMVVDVAKRQIKDTYYIGENGKEVDVLGIAFSSDSVFALSKNSLFSIGKTDNLMDYRNWNCTGNLPEDSTYHAIAVWNNELFVVAKSSFAQRKGDSWYIPQPELKCKGLSLSNNQLYVLAEVNGIFSVNANLSIDYTPSAYSPTDITGNSATYWLATLTDGIVRQTKNETQSFSVNGPLVNVPYRMRFRGDKMIMVPGGYYVEVTGQLGHVMLYENGIWSGFTHDQLASFASQIVPKTYVMNLSDAIIDPNDPTHFFATSLGYGMFEFKDNQLYKWLYGENSELDNIATPANQYTWVDGLAYDSKGNLWMINIANKRNIKVLTRDGQWIAIDHPEANTMQRARDLLIWNQNENIKIISVNHTQQGLLLLNDNGTISYQGDDQCILRTEFVDQDNQQIRLDGLYSIAQDKSGALWVGSKAGLIIIDDPSALFSGNACRKIKIPRNDGTDLADYLLGTEQINAIVVDGANRKWIGTATSGLYVVSEDGLETIHHFTTDNSPLVDNCIISLAIQPSTGKVFIGTGKGLMSYQNDAAPAFEDYSNVYAYPNPIRPDYEGVITITGLMDESIVHIVDNAGNLVCETRSNGGLAIWDGKNADGRRAASGVYTVFLNENENNKHAVTKILVMH